MKREPLFPNSFAKRHRSEPQLKEVNLAIAGWMYHSDWPDWRHAHPRSWRLQSHLYQMLPKMCVCVCGIDSLKENQNAVARRKRLHAGSGKAKSTENCRLVKCFVLVLVWATKNRITN